MSLLTNQPHEPWQRPSQCDSWRIEAHYKGKTLLRRRDRWEAFAWGYQGKEVHACYGGSGLLGEPVYAQTKEEAITRMREKICADINAYYAWAKHITAQDFDQSEVCP